MDQGTTDAIRFPGASSQDVLTGILREGAQKLLAQAIEAEVVAHLEAHQELRDVEGQRPGGSAAVSHGRLLRDLLRGRPARVLDL